MTGWLKSGEEGNPIYADNGMVGNEKSNEEVDKVSVAEEEEFKSSGKELGHIPMAMGGGQDPKTVSCSRDTEYFIIIQSVGNGPCEEMGNGNG